MLFATTPHCHMYIELLTVGLWLLCRPVAPAKNAEYKVRSCDANIVSISTTNCLQVTIDTNRDEMIINCIQFIDSCSNCTFSIKLSCDYN